MCCIGKRTAAQNEYNCRVAAATLMNQGWSSQHNFNIRCTDRSVLMQLYPSPMACVSVLFFDFAEELRHGPHRRKSTLSVDRLVWQMMLMPYSIEDAEGTCESDSQNPGKVPHASLLNRDWTNCARLGSRSPSRAGH